jgi:hypothetical protein
MMQPILSLRFSATRQSPKYMLLPMTKFEYSTVVFDTTALFIGSKLDHASFHAKLNEYGADGWELVNVFDLNRGSGATYEVVAVFKRALTKS